MTRRGAMLILMYMNDIIARYGYVTVADYYDLIGSKIIKYTDDQKGWRSLRGAKIKQVDLFTYKIVLPEPVKIT